jgi:hypothetical protein
MQSFNNAIIVSAILTAISTSPLYGQGTAPETRPIVRRMAHPRTRGNDRTSAIK